MVPCGLWWGWGGLTRCLCAGVSCGPPLHVANGVVRGAVFQFGDVAVYTCFSGYAMEGRSRSRCLENGTWTPPPTCRGDQPPTHTALPPVRFPLFVSPLDESSCPLTASAWNEICLFPLLRLCCVLWWTWEHTNFTFLLDFQALTCTHTTPSTHSLAYTKAHRHRHKHPCMWTQT